jgi:hypothetical protein
MIGNDGLPRHIVCWRLIEILVGVDGSMSYRVSSNSRCRQIRAMVNSFPPNHDFREEHNIRVLEHCGKHPYLDPLKTPQMDLLAPT